MGRVAYLFPGQGAQYVGMGVELAEAFPAARTLFDRASSVLGFDLLELCRTGPEERLQQTENTQPAILVTSLACLEAVRGRIPPPAVAAGLSLGEYSALVCAGSLRFEDAVRVVRLRGQFMQEATQGRQTAMAAVLGLSPEAVEAICQRASSLGVCEASNYNAPDQVVVAGDRAAVEEAVRLARQAGAKRAVLLAVSAPFHTSLMRPAAERLQQVLDSVPLQDARLPVVANVTARPVREASQIRRLLVEQVASPVRWAQSVQRMASEGVDTFVELGPGTVLSGLVRRCVRGAVAVHVEDQASLEKAVAALGALAGAGSAVPQPEAAGGEA
ncbi:MAG: ACP S-malonyltransferase [Armatimonadota bacterium]|nr:ACP S-malonyltransferase [Armatimonadota bacterium]MDW8155120.1 ACP S-malonyltransferase [Armatimonadota bacterium]